MNLIEEPTFIEETQEMQDSILQQSWMVNNYLLKTGLLYGSSKRGKDAKF